jgi:hypothetical protein
MSGLRKWLRIPGRSVSRFSADISVSLANSATTPRPVYLEPWGEDYWLFPGDEFVVRAFDDQKPTAFNIVESADTTQVYVRYSVAAIEVQHNGVRVSCGYQRAQRTGQADHAFTIQGRGIVITSDSPWQGTPKVGDKLRLIIPGKQVVQVQVLGIEHMNAGPAHQLVNPGGLFLGEIGITAEKIAPATIIYKLTWPKN